MGHKNPRSGMEWLVWQDWGQVVSREAAGRGSDGDKRGLEPLRTGGRSLAVRTHRKSLEPRGERHGEGHAARCAVTGRVGPAGYMSQRR